MITAGIDANATLIINPTNAQNGILKLTIETGTTWPGIANTEDVETADT